MYITVHAAAGAAIGQYVNVPWLAFILGMLSHFLLDMIPHGDEGVAHDLPFFKTPFQRIVFVAVIDFLGVITMCTYWINHVPFSEIQGIIYGIVGAIFPDALWGFHELTGTPLLNRYRKLHNDMHEIIKKRITIFQGLIVQLPLLAFFTWVIIRL